MQAEPSLRNRHIICQRGKGRWEKVVVQFESILYLPLGGAAVYRCDNKVFSVSALAAEGRQFSNCTTTLLCVGREEEC